jgi:hypothetical protein
MRQTPAQILLAISGIVICTVCVIQTTNYFPYTYFIGEKPLTFEDLKTPLDKLGVGIKQCILKSNKDLWDNFLPIIQNCIYDHNPALNDTDEFIQLHMGRYGEIKYFLPMVETSRWCIKCECLTKLNICRNATCNWLTIGIGGDSQVEKEFKSIYPHCNLFGIEPGAEDQYADFPKYGTVLPIAVGMISKL